MTIKARSQQSAVARSSQAERLLQAWLGVSTAIRNERFVSELTYNESLICHLLADDAEQGGQGLTATELCRMTQMKKSQMNRTITALESRGLVSRRQAPDDRRRQLLTLNASQMREFDQQHARIIAFVQSVLDEMGRDRADDAISALEDMASAVRRITASE